MIIRLLAVTGIFLVSSAAWSESRIYSTAVEGGYGLLHMQTARTYGKGVFATGLKGMVMNRKTSVLLPSGSTVGEKDNTAVFGFPVTFGLTDEVDVTASFYGFNNARVWKDPYDATGGYSEPEGGLGASLFSVKIRLPFNPESRVQIAGKFGALFETSTKQLDGMNYWWSRTGTDIEASLYETLDITSFLSLNLEQGYIKSGSEMYDDQIVGGAGIQLRIRDKVAFNLEVANRTFRGVSPQSVLKAGDNPVNYLSPEGGSGIGNPLYVKDISLDYFEDYVVCTPSLVICITDNIILDIGANVNLADQVPPKETIQGVVGITFVNTVRSMIDSDGDGVNNRIDIELNTPRGYPVDGRGVALDTDGDGVPDGIDKQPGTTAGARVNASGIGIDSDDDGVYDGIDMEPATPRGCPVDKFGVAYDDDRDGVPNGIDLELNTLLGALVNVNGVAQDDDGDGVPNGLDHEPDTPKGADVDEKGVALDMDGDGVPDGFDMEPNTPKGILVDKSGRALIRQEYSLLKEGLIRLNTINFGIGSTEIDPESNSILDEIGQLLRKYPSLKIQIGGHTDNTGIKEINYKLSRERAIAVREYLLLHFPDLKRDRLMAVGFGSDKPLASNATVEGRNINRRVEFVVISQDELINQNINP